MPITIAPSDQLGSLRTMRSWLLWSFLLLSISAILTISFIYHLINWTIYPVMIIISAGTLIKSALEALYIQREAALASDQVSVLERVETLDAFFNNTTPSIFRTHVYNLYLIAQRGGSVSQSVLIDNIHSRLLSRVRPIEVFSSLLVTIGLIGTIVGLVQMMNSLSFELSIPADESSVSLLERLANPATGPLAGLGTAFYTTLIGATLGGVVLRVLSNITDTHITNYIAHITDLSEIYVITHLASYASTSEGAPRHET